MNMINWQHFWSMGGYAKFLWPSYFIAAVVLIGNVVSAWLNRSRLRKILLQQVSDSNESAA